ncbi:hypothetical protein [Dulcicalothrix desertica]|uniref:hypothetical protein n=1 Tax=Dulcicalothrix desertica TaxID=32056 RepID=UPI00131587BF|nr:hypothetical protein [Dulcicalothrix desertica]
MNTNGKSEARRQTSQGKLYCYFLIRAKHELSNALPAWMRELIECTTERVEKL